ncbi:type II toxin-antitoxin system HicB family antitoxin [Pseudomonas sp. HK3]
MKYPIAIERGNNTEAYGVIFPDVDGCFSAGDDLDEAVKNAKEALEGFLELCAEDGDDLPKPSKLEDHQDNPEYQGFIWAFIEVDITPYLGKSQKINVTLPNLLLHKIDQVVAQNKKYKSRSDFLATAALDELHLA